MRISSIRLSIVIGVLASLAARGQTPGPEVTSWVRNTTGQTGYHGLPTNVQKVEYSTAWVYVACSCIPGYDIGPWPGNPNQPANQNFVFKITRAPQLNSGAPTPTPLGHVGVWKNGVSIFNAKDARSYNNGGVWNQNAIVVEGSSFDSCLGHPAPNGEYHHHLNPRCLYDDHDSLHHSPIIGYAFDGFPIYGAYGFRGTDGSGGVARVRSSYRMRSITKRTTLPDGSTVAAGPDVSAQYPLGYYVEDFEYVQGLGDLDEHNGRFCVTPEYPNGTYAYFVTLDEHGVASYPYTVGLTYRGVVPPGNTGPQSGHNVPSESVVTYVGEASGIESVREADWSIGPNPAYERFAVHAPVRGSLWRATLVDERGREVLALGTIRAGEEKGFSTAGIARGVYMVRLTGGNEERVMKIAINGR
jgi:hypothetical protein